MSESARTQHRVHMPQCRLFPQHRRIFPPRSSYLNLTGCKPSRGSSIHHAQLAHSSNSACCIYETFAKVLFPRSAYSVKLTDNKLARTSLPRASRMLSILVREADWLAATPAAPTPTLLPAAPPPLLPLESHFRRLKPLT